MLLFFGLKIYVKCIPEVVLGGDQVVGNQAVMGQIRRVIVWLLRMPV